MLTDLRKSWAASTAAVGMGLAVTFAPVMGNAQNAEPTTISSQSAEPISVSSQSISSEQREQLRQLGEASYAAREYAQTKYGVGILIHVGKDIPNKHFATADEFGEAVVRAFQERFGVEAEYFLRQNDAKQTGLTFHIGKLIHGADTGNEVKTVKQALASLADVAGLLKVYHGRDLYSKLEQQTPGPGG